MNQSLRTGIAQLERELFTRHQKTKLAPQHEVTRLNELMLIADRPDWKYIRKEFAQMVTDAETTLHFTKNPQEMIEARGRSNAIIDCLAIVDGAAARRMALQESENSQDSALDEAMGAPSAEFIGGQDG